MTKIAPILSPNTNAKIPKINIDTPLNRTLVLEDFTTPVAIKINIPTTKAIMGLIHALIAIL